MRPASCLRIPRRAAGHSAALVDLVHRLARLGEHPPAVAELNLNPVNALGDRRVAVKARVRMQRVEARPRAKSW